MEARRWGPGPDAHFWRSEGDAPLSGKTATLRSLPEGVRNYQQKPVLSRKAREPGFGRGLGDGGRWAKAPRGGPPDPGTPPLPAPGALALSLPPLPPRQAPNSFGAFDVLFPLTGTSHPKSRGTPQSGWLLLDFNSKVKYHLQPPKLIFLHRIYRSLKSVYFRL